MPIKYEEARLVLLILAAAGGEHAILVGALVLVLLGARVQGHEGRSGVVAQLGEILDMRPVLPDTDEESVGSIPEAWGTRLRWHARHASVQGHEEDDIALHIGTRASGFDCGGKRGWACAPPQARCKDRPAASSFSGSRTAQDAPNSSQLSSRRVAPQFLHAQHAHQRSAPSCPLCRQGCELALPPGTQQGHNAWCQVCPPIAPDVSHHIQERLTPANSFVEKLPMCPWPFKTASVLAGLWRPSNKVTAATLQRGTTTATSIGTASPFPAGAFQVHTCRVRLTLAITWAVQQMRKVCQAQAGPLGMDAAEPRHSDPAALSPPCPARRGPSMCTLSKRPAR